MEPFFKATSHVETEKQHEKTSGATENYFLAANDSKDPSKFKNSNLTSKPRNLEGFMDIAGHESNVSSNPSNPKCHLPCKNTRSNTKQLQMDTDSSKLKLSENSDSSVDQDDTLDMSLLTTDVESIDSSYGTDDKDLLASSQRTYRKPSDVEVHVKSIPSLDAHFRNFRLQYLIVHTAIMLADGLQGTHLYVLYQGYGYSVASLYALGFVSGAFTSPFIGPLVDRVGRKRAALAYCVLEIIINLLEQYPLFIGLILSRVVGGITTNLLFSVFESWLVTEHRLRGFKEDKLEIILRDSTIVSNSAAILSGYIAHYLASYFGPVGPFEGAVAFTGLAMVLVRSMWTENFGNSNVISPKVTTFKQHMVEAVQTITGDSKISRIGIIQGLTEGTLQTFVFLWSPALLAFSKHAKAGTMGLDKNGEPAYGIIFGGFMMCGVIGGLLEPVVRKSVAQFTGLSNLSGNDKQGENDINPTTVSCLCALCYMTSALLLLAPCQVTEGSTYAFSICFIAFLIYELMVGLYMPCEAVLRSIYMPNSSMCSIMTMLRVIVNVAVALGVISTNYVSINGAFYALSTMMAMAALLQVSLISEINWMGIARNFGGLLKYGPVQEVQSEKKIQ